MALSEPTLRFHNGSTVAAGDRIGSTRQIIPGAGTYIRGGHIFASAVGKLEVTATNELSNKSGPSHIVSIKLERGQQYASSQVLSVGQTVLGKVVRITMQQATLEIVAADKIGSLREHYGGAIRKEDIRAGATEEVHVHESFRPGDIVLARIISLGDSRRYFLSTTENDLGVIRAVSSISGKVMVPVSWKEMKCPETNSKELRKCAKPRDVGSSSSTTQDIKTPIK